MKYCDLFLVFGLFLSGCAAHMPAQTQLDSLLKSGDYPAALKLVQDPKTDYGRRNDLLLKLDKGVTLHYAGQYAQSAQEFETAKTAFERLYTKSVSTIAATWAINDTAGPYRGEDFERVLVNIFQALNYVRQDQPREALVEARDVDSILRTINDGYPPDKKNIYREDAFARLLMGLIYESRGTPQDYNDAYIEYARAAKIYREGYSADYGTPVPQLLKENLLAAAQFMGKQEFDQWRKIYPQVDFMPWKEKKQKAEVYLIQYNGLAPQKKEILVPVPLPNGYVQYAFPAYQLRPTAMTQTILAARTTGNDGKVFQAGTELGEDISAIAVKNLDNRKARFIAKAIISSTGKFVAEKQIQQKIRRKQGDAAAFGLEILGDVFNAATSRADTRCWLTLPGQIRIARLILEPGEYSLSVTGPHLELGTIKLSPGQKKWFIIKTVE